MARVCESLPTEQVTLAADAGAARRARRFLDDHWCVEHAALLRPQAELIVSELVTNAVLHGKPPVRLALDCEGAEGVTISVSDGDPGTPEMRRASPGAAHGRGLQLVDVLSDEWGVRTRPGGKTVWSRLLV
ncbi:ATP-binding protein [Kineococcus esterisolvens]|uniref:ATP-binding protein n=1 Tax=unclassified Kineococcus TaxID=2621656 RepID=UPI003D7D55B4